MAKVCVITGGGSGMGLEAAKFMSKDKIIIITAANQLTEKVLERDYYPLIIDQIKKKYDKKTQIIYGTIVEREIDLQYFAKDDRAFFKSKKDKQQTIESY